MKQIIFLRHCTTAWNRQKKLQGQSDIPLDDGGEREAHALATTLSVLGIQKIVSSDLKRAHETASIIGAALNILVTTDVRFRENDFGSIAGRTEEEVRLLAPHLDHHVHDDFAAYDFREVGGEDQPSVLKRHMEAYNDLRNHEEGIILVVGHGRGLNTLLHALGEEPNLKRNEWRKLELK